MRVTVIEPVSTLGREMSPDTGGDYPRKVSPSARGNTKSYHYVVKRLDPKLESAERPPERSIL